jgi:hypothetical protein
MSDHQEDTARHELAVASRKSESIQLTIPFDGVVMRMTIKRIVSSAEKLNEAYRWIK